MRVAGAMMGGGGLVLWGESRRLRRARQALAKSAAKRGPDDGASSRLPRRLNALPSSLLAGGSLGIWIRCLLLLPITYTWPLVGLSTCSSTRRWCGASSAPSGGAKSAAVAAPADAEGARRAVAPPRSTSSATATIMVAARIGSMLVVVQGRGSKLWCSETGRQGVNDHSFICPS